MNKKRLSVVMAGAMLASSVAPVLAYTISEDGAKDYEVNGSNKGILIRDLRNLLTSKKFANEPANAGDVSKGTSDVRNQSVYKIEVIAKGGTANADNTFYKLEDVTKLETAIQNATEGTVVKVYDRGHQENNGKYYHYAVSNIEGTDKVFTSEELATEFENWKNDNNKVTNYPAVYKMSLENGVLTVLTRAAESETAHKTLTYKAGDKEVNFKVAIDEKGDVTNDLASVAGFQVAKENGTNKGDEINGKLLANVLVSNIDAKYEVKLSDLYDGLLLTENGQKLLDTMKEYDKDSKKDLGYPQKYNVSDVDTEANGIFSIKILFKYDGKQEELTIKSNDKAKLEMMQKWLRDRKAQVEVLAGDNRYETAVKIAKENAGIEDVAKNGNIVLVNGNALVDGLAAAPLAASVWNKADGESLDTDETTKVAPILLTESDSLPKATKAYIRELVGQQEIQHVDKITVYLVGGEAVISKGLERELKDLGLRVVRAGGDNREETSLEVAEVMIKDGNLSKVDMSNAFVVGAEGEADAMSIAPIAARERNPIIVESKKGLSEEAISKLNGWKNATTTNNTPSVTIVGGETVVSKATEEALKEEKINVTRVAGSNRQNTNAEVISRFARTGLKQIVISKDGQRNKSELIDALTATSLSVKHNAPVVLGTNKLNTNQINAIEKKAQRTGLYVYQVGHGVARDVLKTIADRVGLAK